MSVATGIGIAVVMVFVGLLLLNTGRATREGSFRRGVGWYADMSTPRDVLVGTGPQTAVPETTPTWRIRLWTLAGSLFLIGAVVAAAMRSIPLAVLVGLLGLALLGMAWDSTRRNRRISSRPDQPGRR